MARLPVVAVPVYRQYVSQQQVDPGEPSPFVRGDAAASWFHGLRGGGTVLDDHLIAIRAAFGSDIRVRFRASVNRRTRRPTVLFIEIDRPADDESAIAALIAVQERLLEQEETMAERSRRPRPFANVVVTLGLPPANWDDLVERVSS